MKTRCAESGVEYFMSSCSAGVYNVHDWSAEAVLVEQEVDATMASINAELTRRAEMN